MKGLWTRILTLVDPCHLIRVGVFPHFYDVSSHNIFYLMVNFIVAVHKESRNKPSSRNAYRHSIRNLSSSRLVTSNKKMEMCVAVGLPFVLYGCEKWYLAVREEHTRMFRF